MEASICRKYYLEATACRKYKVQSCYGLSLRSKSALPGAQSSDLRHDKSGQKNIRIDSIPTSHLNLRSFSQKASDILSSTNSPRRKSPTSRRQPLLPRLLIFSRSPS